MSKISIFGFLITFSLLMVSSNDIRSEGSKIRFASIAIKSVTATSPPKACVPPKLEVINTENPKNRTMDV